MNMHVVLAHLAFMAILLFMVALWNRADHIYFHAEVCSFFFFLLFFPRLISAAADWMSANAILPHMVWP